MKFTNETQTFAEDSKLSCSSSSSTDELERTKHEFNVFVTSPGIAWQFSVFLFALSLTPGQMRATYQLV